MEDVNKYKELKSYGIKTRIKYNSFDLMDFVYNDVIKSYNSNRFINENFNIVINEILNLFDIKKRLKPLSENDEKKELLKKYDISFFDSTDNDTVYLLYKNLKIPYSSLNFVLYEKNYLIKDILSKFRINIDGFSKSVIELPSNDTDQRFHFLNENLKKLKITKNWIGNKFYLKKDGINLEYSFEDFINKNEELLISDIVNKFKKVNIKDSINLIIKDNTIKEKKNNIRNILKLKGHL